MIQRIAVWSLWLWGWYAGLAYGQAPPPSGDTAPVVPLRAPVKTCVSQEQICFTFQDYGPDVEITFNYPASLGWVGLGIGIWMEGSDIMLGWHNPDDGTVTLGGRKARGYVEPRLSPRQHLQLNATGSGLVGADHVNIVFRRKKVTGDLAFTQNIQDTDNDFIWAYSRVNPASHDPGAPLALHNEFGKLSLNLASGASMTEAGGNRKPLTFIHAMLLFFGWNAVPYLGILAAGPLKPRLGHLWFKIHVALLGFLAPILVSVGIILVLALTQGPHLANAHEILGIIVFILMFVQIILGVVIDKLWDPERTSVPWYDQLHWWLGRGLYILAQINIILGLIQWNSDALAMLPIWTLYPLLLVLELGLFVLLSRPPRCLPRLAKWLSPPNRLAPVDPDFKDTNL